MRKNLFLKSKILIVIILLIGTCLLPINFVTSSANEKPTTYDDSEYWALLVAVGIYADDSEQNRPLMLEEVDDLYDTFLSSEIWSEDHIKLIKGEDGTVTNIISGLRWLDRMEDENDFSVVYITTHGAPFPFDIPPRDEADGTDEMLSSYWSFAYPTQFIYDDELNFLLNRLESSGVCLIIDSCYAGGFNDSPNWNLGYKNIFSKFNKKVTMTAEEWIEGFGKELSGQNRVVLMASREDEVSYSGGFAPYLIDGLRGYADSNEDKIVTAEEVYTYCQPRCYRQHPTIYDLYPGEFPLVYLSDYKQNYNLENYNINTNYKTINLYKSDENSVINGFVKDANSDDPIIGALINIRGFLEGWDSFENETYTDSLGYYSINVPACRYRMTVSADGYCSSNSQFLEIGENEIDWVNFSLYQRPPENSIIYGYITDDENSQPIEGANIDLLWQGDQDQFYYNETTSDINGFFSINVAAGEIDLNVDATGYFQEHINEVIISDYVTYWINLTMISKPPENSILCGYITDIDTGEPIDNARITIQWIDITLGQSYQNETFTDSLGFYNINIASGELYVDIRKQGYDYYDPYRHDENENLAWYNVSLEKNTIEVDIVKPLRALYINNNRLVPYYKARIIGPIDIEVNVYEDWWGPAQVEKVEFYIDGELKKTIPAEPYTWTWSELKIGKHTIKVTAYDYEGNTNSKEIEVYKFL